MPGPRNPQALVSGIVGLILGIIIGVTAALLLNPAPGDTPTPAPDSVDAGPAAPPAGGEDASIAGLQARVDELAGDLVRQREAARIQLAEAREKVGGAGAAGRAADRRAAPVAGRTRASPATCRCAARAARGGIGVRRVAPQVVGR
jgi:hypothetical protein